MSLDDILTITSIAFLSSLSHCYAMCGGFNLAFMRLNTSGKNPLFFSFSYHLMRISAYVFLGAICGAFGKVIALNAQLQSLFLFILGFFMMLLGLALILGGKFLSFFEKNILFDLFFKKMMKKLLKLQGLKPVLILGFCNGFVPCAVVYFFLASALSQSTFYNGVFIMLIFGISTLPALLFFTQLFALLERFHSFLRYLQSFLIIYYGLKLSFNALF